MKQGLPSLNLLMVFEVAARTLSFKKAAEELHVTPPAVSHQIRVLEKELGIALFIRLNRSIELSEEGIEYYRGIAPAIEQLRQATSLIKTSGDKSLFKVISIPFITNALLVPHIQQFMDLNPSLHVSILSQLNDQDINQSDTMIAIQFGRGNDPELHYEPLSRIFISPVCSRSYLEKHPAIEPKDIFKHPLVKMSSDKNSWPFWAQFYALSLSTDNDFLLDNYQGVLDAIKQDMGIAMGYFPMLKNTQGEPLIVPIFPDRQCEFGSIYLVYRERDKQNPEILSFKNWLNSLFVAL